MMVPLIRARTSAAHYDLAHADKDGRLAIRTAAAVLEWSAETRLSASPDDLGIVVTASPAGRLKLSSWMRLRLPIALRRRSGLTAGAPALLVADTNRRELIIYSATALDAMIAAWHPTKAGDAA